MKITQRRKCEVCEAPVTLVREFAVTINLFEADANPLSGELLEEITAWRRKKVYCDEHEPEEGR